MMNRRARACSFTFLVIVELPLNWMPSAKDPVFVFRSRSNRKLFCCSSHSPISDGCVEGWAVVAIRPSGSCFADAADSLSFALSSQKPTF